MVRNVPIRDHAGNKSMSEPRWNDNGDSNDDSQNSQVPISHAVRIMAIEIEADLQDLEQFYNISISSTRITRLRDYLTTKLSELQSLPFKRLIQEAKVDYISLRNFLQRRIRVLDSDQSRNEELKPLFDSWMYDLVDLLERRQSILPSDGQKAAGTLANASSCISDLKAKILNDKFQLDSFAAFRAAIVIEEIQKHFVEWHTFYSGYDPVFTWWITQPYSQLISDLQTLRSVVRSKLVGIDSNDSDAIVGQPIGRQGLLDDLEAELIPYTPEELITIGEKEYAWCENQMILASRALGFGDTWRSALEHVKTLYVPPGSQPQLVRELATEAVDYVTKTHDMVTIPPLAAETWRSYMMTPAAQKANPFFLGGPYIQISYPTDTMSHSEKLMSMRGNSRPFSRSTVFHELLPGHHLQWHYMARYKTYRANLFFTPFWTEGWAFYWEFILWDRGFAATAEEKIGMLFWRMHRCARILFSLNFHLGKWTPQQCIDFLVDKVGHERATAEGEVRRSFNGDYGPLYQAGYMLGALQLYALRDEMVGEEGKGKLKEKEFHDRILRENQMSIEMLRALLKNEELTSDYKAKWRFYDAREKQLDLDVSIL